MTATMTMGSTSEKFRRAKALNTSGLVLSFTSLFLSVAVITCSSLMLSSRIDYNYDSSDWPVIVLLVMACLVVLIITLADHVAHDPIDDSDHLIKICCEALALALMLVAAASSTAVGLPSNCDGEDLTSLLGSCSSGDNDGACEFGLGTVFAWGIVGLLTINIWIHIVAMRICVAAWRSLVSNSSRSSPLAPSNCAKGSNSRVDSRVAHCLGRRVDVMG